MMEASTGEHDWQRLAQTLADGFQSLLREVELLSIKEQDLQARLKFATQEVCPSSYMNFSLVALQEEKTLISSRSRAVQTAMSEINMYYLIWCHSFLFSIDLITYQITDTAILSM